jgi:predicted RNA-binding protein with PIN domain
MHIIIDGYNLIRQSDVLRRYERTSLEAGRMALVHRIAAYQKLRPHRLTVVFDGREGDSPTEQRDLMEGVLVVYSRRGERADDVIKRMAEKSGEEIVVVTSDHGIADFVARRGGTAIPSPEFEARIAGLPQGPPEGAPEAELTDNDDREGRKKKGPARRLSKRQKAARAKMRKL